MICTKKFKNILYANLKFHGHYKPKKQNKKTKIHLPAKRKTNSTGTFSLELNCVFFFTLETVIRASEISQTLFIMFYIFLRENTNTIVLNPFDKKETLYLAMVL